MINSNNLNKLYTAVTNGEELTTKSLNEMGFNSKDLKELVDSKKLDRVKRGFYEFKDDNELFFFGKRLLREKRYEEADECFKRCIEINPNHNGACFQLFVKYIKEKNYEQAFEYFKKLGNSENQFYNIDYNYYLFLLNIITEVPDEYKEFVKSIQMEDIRVRTDDKRFIDASQQNRLRYAAYQRKLPYALQQQKAIIAQNKGASTQDYISQVLLTQAAQAEDVSKNTIGTLADQKDYEGLIAYLEEKQNKMALNQTEVQILNLVNVLLTIQETKEIPESKYTQEPNLFTAINDENYEYALKLAHDFNEKNNVAFPNNVLEILLYDICELIRTLKEDTKRQEAVKTVSEPKRVVTFASITASLLKNDIKTALEDLNVYMESIEKPEYTFLIVGLIRISLLEKELAFTKPMLALTLLSKNDYKFDISIYIQEFYIALSKKQFDIARIYLDIITRAKNLGIETIDTSNLYKVLESSVSLLHKNDVARMEVPPEVKAKPKETFEETEETMELERQASQRAQETIFENKTPYVPRDSEKEFIEGKHQELVERKGALLLKPMSDERIDNILDMLEDYPDIRTFTFQSGANKQLVLKYHQTHKEYIDYKALLKEAEVKYRAENYQECLDICLQLLGYFEQPNAYIYGRIGLCYMKQFRLPLAIEYLTIATNKSRLDDENYDFSELIAKLRGDKFEADTIKPKFKMKESDFNSNDINNFFGIDNIEEVCACINENGLDIDAVAKDLGYSPEDINLIKLIYAREYYIQAEFEKGDALLKQVERSKEKNDVIKKAYAEIKKNRRFYPNRQLGENRPVILPDNVRK